MKPAPIRPIFSYSDAREYIMNHTSLKSRSEYIDFCRSKECPLELVRNPRAYYKGQWGGWDHYLGATETRKAKKRPVALPYEEACILARKLGIKNRISYIEARQQGLLPEGMPSRPDEVYKEDFVNWALFLGLADDQELERPRSHKIHPYKLAQQIVIGAKISSMDEYLRFRLTATGAGLPLSPKDSYRGKGFRSFEEFITGNRRHSTGRKEFLPFEEARILARTQNCLSRAEYTALARMQRLPLGLPISAQAVYADKGWIGWKDFLGIKDSKRYLSHDKARTLLSTLGLKNADDYKKVFSALKARGIDNLPFHPESTYRRKGEWQGWNHFLSMQASDDEQVGRMLYKQCKEALKVLNPRPRTRAQFESLASENALPGFVPRRPDYHFSKLGLWKGFRDFLSVEVPSCSEAIELIKSMQISSMEEYREKFASGCLPSGYPRNPESFYKIKGEWCGRKSFFFQKPKQNAANRRKKSVEISEQERLIELAKYAEAKVLLRTLGINSISKYRKNRALIISHNLPGSPDKYFSKSGIWKGYRDLFSKSSTYVDFKEIQLIAADLFKSGALSRPSILGLVRNCKEAGISGVPSSEKTFKKVYGHLYTSIDDLFGISRPSYDECSALAKRLKISCRSEWREKYKGQEIPRRYPAWPELAYEEFAGWTEFLGLPKRGSGRITLDQAKDLVKELGINNLAEYRAFAGSDVGRRLGLPLNLKAYLKHHEGSFSVLQLFDRPSADRAQYGQSVTIYSDENPWNTK